MSDFELVQVHECVERDYAEVVIRDKNGRKAYAGNLSLMNNPRQVYPPSSGETHVRQMKNLSHDPADIPQRSGANQHPLAE